MDLTVYDIVRKPIVSGKAYKLNSQLKQLVLEVHPHSNKSLVKQALEKLFDVKVDKVRIVVRKGRRKKSRTTKNRLIQGKTTKKAYITLKEGYNMDMFTQSGANVVTPQDASVKAS